MRTALVAKELSQYNTDISALSETQLICEGSTNWGFQSKGKAVNDDRIYGVCLAIKTGLMKHLPDLLVGINERIESTMLVPQPKLHATVVSTYAPQWQVQKIPLSSSTLISAPLVLCPCQWQVNIVGWLQCLHWLWPQSIGGSVWQAWDWQDEKQWPPALQ